MSERKVPWRTLLFVSVALNLLAVGAIAGAMGAGVRLEREAPQESVARMPGARAFMAALPVELRIKMRHALADSWVESRARRQEARAARRAAFEEAATEPYDAERVRDAFARMRAADQAAIGVFHDGVIEALANLTPEERSAAMDALRRAAPAQRANAQQQDGAATDEVAPLDDAAVQERREAFREKMRERRRERLERRQQEQQP